MNIRRRCEKGKEQRGTKELQGKIGEKELEDEKEYLNNTSLFQLLKLKYFINRRYTLGIS